MAELRAIHAGYFEIRKKVGDKDCEETLIIARSPPTATTQ